MLLPFDIFKVVRAELSVKCRIRHVYCSKSHDTSVIYLIAKADTQHLGFFDNGSIRR